MLKTTVTLPANFRACGTLDLGANRLALLGVTAAGAALLLPFGWLVQRFLLLTRPGDGSFEGVLNELGIVMVLGFLLGLTAVVAIIHESIHGLFFWLVTRRRPVFGFRGPYAYAAAPACHIPRDPYLVTGLAPLVLMTLAGLALLLLVPVWALPAVAFMVIFNGAGCSGDLVVVGWLLTRPRDTLVCDRGDACTIYQPA